MTEKFLQTVLIPILASIREYGAKNAFCINGEYYSYNDFKERIIAIREQVGGGQK